MTRRTDLARHFWYALVVALPLRLFFIWRFPTEAGDTRIYEELARNWLARGVYGLWIGGHLIPVDIRVPGYPAFLAAIYGVFGWPEASGRLILMLAQALIDLLTCFLTAVLAGLLVPAHSRARVVAAGVWLAALCPFVANYTAVPLTEALAAFFTTLALTLLVAAYGAPENSAGREGRRPVRVWIWFPGGLVVGLGTLVRPETPLLLAAIALVLCVRWRRVADWPKLLRVGLALAAGLVLPLLPWAARNLHTLGRAQFLAPRYAELAGEFVPRGFYTWTKTWLVRFQDDYTLWKLEEEPIHVEELPAAAFDSAAERARVAALLEQYNDTLSLTLVVDAEFARLGRERAARHPLRTYVRIPLERAATLWFTPRVELLPFTGHLWPPRERWEEDHVDFSVTLGFELLIFLFVGLALAGAWRARRQPGLALPVAVLLVRTAYFTQIELPEPRYMVVCIPTLLALAALVWAKACVATP